MEDTYRDILSEYRSCTLKIIEVIQSGNLESLERLIAERQRLVEDISNSTLEKEKLKQIYKELKIEELQGELNLLISKKLSFIKGELEKIDKNKMVNHIYNKGNFTNAKIFSKKI